MTTVPVPAPSAVETPRRAYWTPVLVSLLSIATGFAVLWSVRHQLPEPMVRHWGVDGRPDGWWSVRANFVFSVLFPLGMSAFLVGMGALTRQMRAMAPLASGLSVFLSVLVFGSSWSQRGQTSATAADVNWPMWVGTAAGAVVGLLVWLATRDTGRHLARTGPSADAPRVPVAPGAKLAWTGVTRSSGGTWAAVVLSLVPTLAMAALFTVLGNPSMGLFMVVLTAVLVVLMSALRCRVSVDARGVRALGLGLVPWVRIPLAEIEQASIARVDALGEFGGWGYRGKNDGSGSWGLVTAGGEALVVERAGKAPFYLTVDGARDAAAAVNTLVSRR